MADLAPYRTPRWVKIVGIIALVLVLLAGVVLLVDSNQHGPGSHVPSDGAGSGTSPTRGDEISADLGGPADADAAGRTVAVTARDTLRFEPTGISVSAGETVTFRVTNAGQTIHEFTLGDAAQQQEHAAEMAQMDGGMAHGDPNSITLQPGETRELTWRFGEAGTLEYACHEPGHYAAGMRGEITVQPTGLPAEGQER